MMKVDRKKVLALAAVLQEALIKHLDKTPMSAGEIALALTQVIYCVGRVSAEMEREEALRGLDRVAA